MHAPSHPSPISFDRLIGTRIVATPDALDLCQQQTDTVMLRLAPDELYVTPPLTTADLAKILAVDPHAIVVADGAFSGTWIAEARARLLLGRLAEWDMPPQSTKPIFVQGAVAGIATKLYFSGGRVLFLVQTPYAHELEERLV